eukprot:TRINITY_DN20526_c0_g1_i1.p1 TRINITY_DN20526_c0_g1~~TRINITY_DN20526_c0_g1_i1.p1  ORF type:complete len:360 (+),score=56.22 TRINITY_DN20526_c0_g1_i1:92-1081(+)
MTFARYQKAAAAVHVLLALLSNHAVLGTRKALVEEMNAAPKDEIVESWSRRYGVKYNDKGWMLKLGTRVVSIDEPDGTEAAIFSVLRGTWEGEGPDASAKLFLRATKAPSYGLPVDSMYQLKDLTEPYNDRFVGLQLLPHSMRLPSSELIAFTDFTLDRAPRQTRGRPLPRRSAQAPRRATQPPPSADAAADSVPLAAAPGGDGPQSDAAGAQAVDQGQPTANPADLDDDDLTGALQNNIKLISLRSTLDDALRCPITKQVMSDPVIAADGHTYEREAILSWFKRKKSSPKTGDAVPHTGVITNQLVLTMLKDLEKECKQPGVCSLKKK